MIYNQYPVNIYTSSIPNNLVPVFFDSGSQINAMHLTFAKKLGLIIHPTNINIQKIDNTIFKTYKMIVAAFSIINQAKRVKFFKKTFLVVNISPNVVFGMLFFTLNNANVNFAKKEFWQRFYTIEKAFPIIKQVQLIRKKKFTAFIFDLRNKTFIINVIFLNSPNKDQKKEMYLFYKVQIAALMINKAFTLISTEYFNFINIFSSKLTFKLFKNTGINNYIIKLIDK